jgi:hypothetical protein
MPTTHSLIANPGRGTHAAADFIIVALAGQRLDPDQRDWRARPFNRRARPFNLPDKGV